MAVALMFTLLLKDGQSSKDLSVKQTLKSSQGTGNEKPLERSYAPLTDGNKNNIHSNSPHTYSFPNALFIFVDGCSMSSASYYLILKLLKAHGVNVIPLEKDEQTKPENNIYYNSKDEQRNTIPKAIHAIVKDAEKNGTTFFFKIPRMDAPLRKVLEETGARMVELYRDNALDHLICSIRDCFTNNDDFYAVNDRGHKSDLCFHRRKTGRTIYAYLNPATVVEQITTFDKKQYYRSAQVKAWSFPHVHRVTTEDLLAFEYEHDGGYQEMWNTVSLNKSVHAYVSVLHSFGIHPNRRIVWELLSKERLLMDKPRQREAHSASIYNFHKVAEAIYRCGDDRIISFLRLQ